MMGEMVIEMMMIIMTEKAEKSVLTFKQDTSDSTGGL